MAIKSVKLSEANQRFSKIIQQLEIDGIPVRILRRDKFVAFLCPDNGNIRSIEERKAAFDELRTLHAKGLDLGGMHVNRSDLYDRQ